MLALKYTRTNRMIISLYSHAYFFPVSFLSFLFLFLFLSLLFLLLDCSVITGSNHEDILDKIVMTIAINPIVVLINCYTRLLLFTVMLLLPCLALFPNMSEAQME